MSEVEKPIFPFFFLLAWLLAGAVPHQIHCYQIKGSDYHHNGEQDCQFGLYRFHPFLLGIILGSSLEKFLWTDFKARTITKQLGQTWFSLGKFLISGGRKSGNSRE
jgi:hypothetical protein